MTVNGTKNKNALLECSRNDKCILIMATVSIFIVSSILIIGNSYNAFAAQPSTERNGIVLTGMRTEPSDVNVGDNFTIHATLGRYSPYGLEVWGNLCAGPLQATFDKNVAVEKGITGCPPEVRVRPTFPIVEVSTPLVAGDMFNPFTDHFKATSAGITNATLNLEYRIVTSENATTEFNRDNATLISCFKENKMFSPCSFEFTILP